MSSMNSLELEVEVGRIARAMMTRNSEIGKELIEYLRTQLTIEAVAGVVIVSIERLIWFDVDAVFWTIENLIPADVMHEIRRMTTVVFYQRLISKKFVPGQDFSVDANGKLLVSDRARTAMFTR
ncbi:MAG: hypothetical protein JOZ78_14850 [Chroococcidiopsidaceae cyanobacterium CP_BM_ER_R8_30]|nr:hypothetical protein [Chroococcidiopsidaceae cyanobacterium CP_BM_ER_R8_30]